MGLLFSPAAFSGFTVFEAAGANVFSARSHP